LGNFHVLKSAAPLCGLKLTSRPVSMVQLHLIL